MSEARHHAPANQCVQVRRRNVTVRGLVGADGGANVAQMPHADVWRRPVSNSAAAQVDRPVQQSPLDDQARRGGHQPGDGHPPARAVKGQGQDAHHQAHGGGRHAQAWDQRRQAQHQRGDRQPGRGPAEDGGVVHRSHRHGHPQRRRGRRQGPRGRGRRWRRGRGRRRGRIARRLTRRLVGRRQLGHGLSSRDDQRPPL